MNKSLFHQAQSAYNGKDYATALDLYNRVAMDQGFPLESGEYGQVYHQIGNCLVKLGNYTDAISAYVNATSDGSYIAKGTVFYNLGMAYALMNDFGNAINNFQVAINTQNYRSKYKAYTAMGNALMKSGKSADAAAAFRSAAMDARNPDPTRALLNLGVCFMALNRSADAISVYESAFQFSMSDDLRNRLNANLGQAYVASGQMQKAVTAFENALRDKSYVLSDSASVDYQRAIAAVSKGAENVDVKSAGPKAAAAAGMAGGVIGAAAGAAAAPGVANAAPVGAGTAPVPADPYAPQTTPQNPNFGNPAQPIAQAGVSPMGQAQEDEFDKWTKSTQNAAYNKAKKRRPVRTFFIVLLFILAGAIIAGSVAFCFGFGFPSQEMTVKELFANPIANKDTVFEKDMNELNKNSYISMITPDANPAILGVKRAVNDSTVYVEGKTQSGGLIEYKVRMSRDLLG